MKGFTLERIMKELSSEYDIVLLIQEAALFAVEYNMKQLYLQ